MTSGSLNLKIPEKTKKIIKALIIAKLIYPASEHKTYKWLKYNSSLGEILNIDFSSIGKDSIYRAGDILLNYKQIIENQLSKQEKKILKLEEKVLLYDLTNTFIEGRGEKNELAKYGRSKEKRTDCPLITLALIVDERGYPKISKIFKGNQSEPATLEEIMKDLNIENSQLSLFKTHNIIMDRGIATKKNIDWLEKNEYNYVVIERANRVKTFEKEFENIEDFNEIKKKNNKILIKRITKDKENFLLCSSEQKKIKELKILKSKENRLEKELNKFSLSLIKNNKSENKVIKKLGRLSEKYFSVYNLYKIDIIKNDVNEVSKIEWNKIDEVKLKTIGKYVIKTNNLELEENEIWNIYMTLTKVEHAFRVLKTDLYLRPIYHQTTDRSKSHIFITILAYHLLNYIEEIYKSNNKQAMNFDNIKQLLLTQQLVSLEMTTKDSKLKIIRLTTKPESYHKKIYENLNINLKEIKIRKEILKCNI